MGGWVGGCVGGWAVVCLRAEGTACLPGLPFTLAPALPALQVDIREAETRAARSEREREATERSMAAELEELQAALQVGSGGLVVLGAQGAAGVVAGLGGRQSGLQAFQWL